MIRNCPICRVGKVYRREVKTCGAPDCVELWRNMTASQRARAVDEAMESFVELPRPTFDKPIPTIHSPEAPDSTTKRDNEALKRIFGEDNPPGAVPDELKDPNSPKKP